MTATTSGIAAAPKPTTLGQSASPPTTECGLPEAVVLACALAGWGNPMSGMDAQAAFLARVIARVRADYTLDEIVRFDQRGTMTATESQYRWEWARTVVQRHFPDAEGVTTLPLRLDEAGLPDPPPTRR